MISRCSSFSCVGWQRGREALQEQALSHSRMWQGTYYHENPGLAANWRVQGQKRSTGRSRKTMLQMWFLVGSCVEMIFKSHHCLKKKRLPGWVYLLIYLLIKFYMFEHFVYIYMFTMCRPDTHGGQKRVPEPLELELWMVVDCHVGVEKITQQVILTVEPPLQSWVYFYSYCSFNLFLPVFCLVWFLKTFYPKYSCWILFSMCPDSCIQEASRRKAGDMP